jgi:hypothetical protein
MRPDMGCPSHVACDGAQPYEVPGLRADGAHPAMAGTVFHVLGEQPAEQVGLPRKEQHDRVVVGHVANGDAS